jgi:HSP20 family protein
MLRGINRLLEEAFGPLGLGREEELGFGTWIPSCDVYETQTEMVIKAELPEVKKEDIKVSVDGNALTLRGERKLEKDVKEENYRRIERSYGEFIRTFTIPPALDPNSLSAEFKDGFSGSPFRSARKPKLRP